MRRHFSRPSFVLCLLFTFVLTGVAQAQGLAPNARASLQPNGTRVIRVPMNVDCSRVPNTAEAHGILAAHNLCGYGKRSGGVSPDNSVTGPCGTLSLSVFDSGGGYMQWKGEITSSLGPFVSASYSGSWANITLGTNGPVGRSYGGFTTDWVDVFPILTGPGSVYARINTATDTLAYGLQCTNGSPVDDSTTVSS